MAVNSGLPEQPGVLAAAWRHRILVLFVTGLFATLGWWITGQRPPLFVAQATVVLEDPGAPELLESSQTPASERLVANQLEVFRSGLVARAAEELVEEAGFSLSAGDILAGTVYTTIRGTDVILIEFSSPDPDEAEAVTNNIIRAYDQVQREQRRTANTAVLARLDSAEGLLRTDLDNVVEEIDTLRSARSLSTEIDVILTRVAQLQGQLSAAVLPETAAALQTELAAYAVQLEILRLAVEIESERPDLASLLETRTAIQGQLDDIAARRNDLELQVELEGSGIAFTSPATTSRTIAGSSILFSTVGGLLLGLFISMGLASALGSVRKGFKDWVEPEEIVGGPVLAAIPKWNDSDPSVLPTRDDPRSPSAEAFRFAAGNLEVRLQRVNQRSVAFVSADVGEGKSTLLANTAAAAARAGRRVLVVDADFGSQTASQILLGDLEIGRGLTELAAGSVDLWSAVSRVDVGNDVELHVLSRGLRPVTAPDFFSSEEAKRVFDDLTANYDLVFIDCPPLLHVAYASNLVRLARATVLVIPHGSSIRSAGLLASRLKLIEASVIGYLYNRAPQSRVRNSDRGSLSDILGDRGMVAPMTKVRSGREN